MSLDLRTVSKWSQSVADALVSSGRLSREDAQRALARCATESTPILTVLAGEGLVPMGDGLECLSAISGVRAVDVHAQPPTPDALVAVPSEVAHRYRSVGYRIEDGRIVIASAEPLGVSELRALAGSLDRGLAGCVLVDPSVVDRLLDDPDAFLAAVSPPVQTVASTAISQPDILAALGAPDPGFGPQLPVEPDNGPVGQPGQAGDGAGREPAGEPNTPGSAAAPGSPATSAHTPSAPGGAGPGTGPGAGSASQGVPAPVGLVGYPATGTTAADEVLGISGAALRLDLDSLLVFAVENGASDLHLAEGFPPALRIDGSIRRIAGMSPLDNNQLRRMVFSILPQAQRERFEATKELDTSHSVLGSGRFRVNVFQQRGAIGAVLRMIPSEVPPFESLGIPKVVASFAELRRGLVLVTGPTGSGKSTTLASIVDIVNRTKPLHIMTVEDPIEFLHSHRQSIVNQREVGQDTESFAESLRHVLRQDPDVILVGELRDLETISTALTAAETGHLVFATLHTQDAPQTIDRMIDVFPPSQQDQVRIQLAGALEAVVTQQLVLAASGVGRVPVAEVMVCTAGIRNLIRSGKTHQVYSLMQTGGSEGMQTMDQALARAVSEEKITEAMAYDRSRDPKQLQDYLRS